MLKRLLALLTGVTLTLGIVGFAHNVDRPQPVSAGEPLETAYRTNLETCSIAGQPQAACAARAESTYRIARAEEQIARAKADYALARQRCSALAEGEKSACMKEAKDVRRIARTKARAIIRAAQKNAPVAAVTSGKS